MDKIQASTVILQHPRLFGTPPFDPKKTLMCFGFECDQGWYPIIIDALSKMEQLDLPEDFRITQIKEKFGTLRIYTNITIPAVTSIITEAEDLAAKTCEICGKPGTLDRSSGYYQVLCPEHSHAK